MTEDQFQQLVSAIEQSNQTHWWEYIIDALIAALVAVVVTYSMEGIRNHIRNRLAYNNLLVISDDIRDRTAEIYELIIEKRASIENKKADISNLLKWIRGQLNSSKGILIDFNIESGTLARSLDAILKLTERQIETVARISPDNLEINYTEIRLIYNNYLIFLTQFENFTKNSNVVYLSFGWLKHKCKNTLNWIRNKFNKPKSNLHK